MGAVNLMAVNVKHGLSRWPGEGADQVCLMSRSCDYQHGALAQLEAPQVNQRAEPTHLFCRWSPNRVNGLPPAAGLLNLFPESLRHLTHSQFVFNGGSGGGGGGGGCGATAV